MQNDYIETANEHTLKEGGQVLRLICRRLMSWAVNATVILVLLAVLFFVTAAISWFIPFGTFDVRIFSLLFAITYSLLGSYSVGSLPQLGKKISGLQQQSIRSNPPLKVKILIKLGIAYSVPFLILFGPGLLLKLFDLTDYRITTLLISLLVYCTSFAGLALPVSIIIGKGKQGIHDALAGLAVCRKNSEIGPLLSLRPLLARTFIATTIISFAATVLILKVAILLNFHTLLFQVVNKDSNMVNLEKIISDIDAIIPATPVNYRNIDTKNGLHWWVDLSNAPQEQIRVNRSIGLTGKNSRDLFGYGFSINKLRKPIYLMNAKRNKEITLQPETEMLTVYLFVDAGAFYFDEVKQRIHNYFAPRVGQFAVNHSFDILRIKIIRMVKVGYVELGFFDEGYMVDDDFWRDKEMAYYPVICTFRASLDNTHGMISSADIE